MNWKILAFLPLLWPRYESAAQTTETKSVPTTYQPPNDLPTPVRINATTLNGNLELSSLEIMAEPTSSNGTKSVEADTKSLAESSHFEGTSREANPNSSSQSDSSSFDEEADPMTDALDTSDVTNDSVTSGDVTIDERHKINDNASKSEVVVKGLNNLDVDERDPSVDMADHENLFSGPDTETDEPIFQISDPTEKNFFDTTDDDLIKIETTTDLVLPMAFYDSQTKVNTSADEDEGKITLEKSSTDTDIKTTTEENVDTDESDSSSELSESSPEKNLKENENDKDADVSSSILFQDIQETITENEEDLLATTLIDDTDATVGEIRNHEGRLNVQPLETKPSTESDQFNESTIIIAEAEETVDSVTVKTENDIKYDFSSVESESLESTTQYNERITSKISLRESVTDNDIKTTTEGNVDTDESDSSSELSESSPEKNLKENENDKDADVSSSILFQDRQETITENEEDLLATTLIGDTDATVGEVRNREDKLNVQQLETEPSTKSDQFNESTTIVAEAEETVDSITVKTEDDTKYDFSSAESESLESTTQYNERITSTISLRESITDNDIKTTTEENVDTDESDSSSELSESSPEKNLKENENDKGADVSSSILFQDRQETTTENEEDLLATTSIDDSDVTVGEIRNREGRLNVQPLETEPSSESDQFNESTTIVAEAEETVDSVTVKTEDDTKNDFSSVESESLESTTQYNERIASKVSLRESITDSDIKTTTEENVDTDESDSSSELSESSPEKNLKENENDKDADVSSSILFQDRQETTTENEEVLLATTPIGDAVQDLVQDRITIPETEDGVVATSEESESLSIISESVENSEHQSGQTDSLVDVSDTEEKRNVTGSQMSEENISSIVNNDTTNVLNEDKLDQSFSLSFDSQQKEDANTETNEEYMPQVIEEQNPDEGIPIVYTTISTLTIESEKTNEDITDDVSEQLRFEAKLAEVINEGESNSISDDSEVDGSYSLASVSQENEGSRKVEGNPNNEINTEVADNITNESMLVSSETATENNSGTTHEDVEESLSSFVDINKEISSDIEEGSGGDNTFDEVPETTTEILNEGELENSNSASSIISEETEENTKSVEEVMETTTKILNEDDVENLNSFIIPEENKENKTSNGDVSDDALDDNSDSMSSSSQQNEEQTEMSESSTTQSNNFDEEQSTESISAGTLTAEVNTEVNEDHTDSIIQSMFASTSTEIETATEDIQHSDKSSSLEINKNLSSGILEENEDSNTSGEVDTSDGKTEATTDILNATEEDVSSSLSSDSQQKEDLDTEFTTEDNAKKISAKNNTTKNDTNGYTPLIVLININIKVNSTDNKPDKSIFDNSSSEVIRNIATLAPGENNEDASIKIFSNKPSEVVKNIANVAPGENSYDTSIKTIESKDVNTGNDEVTELNVGVTQELTESSDMTEARIYPETSTEINTEYIDEEIAFTTSIPEVLGDEVSIIETQKNETVDDFVGSGDEIDSVHEDSSQVKDKVHNETVISPSNADVLEETLISSESWFKKMLRNESTSNVGNGTDMESEIEEVPENFESEEDGEYGSSYTSEEFGSENFSEYDESILASSELKDGVKEVPKYSLKGNGTENVTGTIRNTVVNTVLSSLWSILSKSLDSSKENRSISSVNGTRTTIAEDGDNSTDSEGVLVVPSIQDRVFGRDVNFSVEIIVENQTIYAPSTAYLVQDPANYTLNITWNSSSKGLNNSLWLRMMPISKYLIIHGVQLGIVKDGDMSIWKQETIVVPKITSTANYSSVVKFKEGVVVSITSPDGDFLQELKETEEKLTSSTEEVYLQIAMGATISALIVVGLILVFVIKGWRRSQRREFKPDLYYTV